MLRQNPKKKWAQRLATKCPHFLCEAWVQIRKKNSEPRPKPADLPKKGDNSMRIEKSQKKTIYFLAKAKIRKDRFDIAKKLQDITANAKKIDFRALQRPEAKRQTSKEFSFTPQKKT
jgi:hypothetical protein